MARRHSRFTHLSLTHLSGNNFHTRLRLYLNPLLSSFLVSVSSAGFFVATAAKITATARLSKLARESIANRQRKDKWLFLLYTKLALLMGLTWVFGFVAAYADSVILWWLFIFANSLQGFFILVAFTSFKATELLKLVSPLRKISFASSRTTSTSTNTAISKL